MKCVQTTRKTEQVSRVHGITYVICGVLLLSLVGSFCWVVWGPGEGRLDADEETIQVQRRQHVERARRDSARKEDRTTVAKEEPIDEVVDPEPPESAQEPVFDVGGKSFRSLAEAVDAAEPGATIKLKDDAYVRNPVAVRKNLRFDLNGHCLTAQNSKIPLIKRQHGDFGMGGNAISVVGGHDVVVENGTINVVSNGGRNGFTGAVEQVNDLSALPEGAAPDSPASASESASESEAVAQEQQPEEPSPVAEHPEDADFITVLRDLTVTSDAQREAVFHNSEGRMLIDNCQVEADGGVPSYTVGANSSTTIRNSDFQTIGEPGWGQWWNSAVATAFDGTATVESGTYVSQMAEGEEGTTYGMFVYSSGGVIDVKGGEILAEHATQALKDMKAWGVDYGAAEVVIHDGVVSGTMESRTTGSSDGEPMAGMSVYGGVYDNKPQPEHLPEGSVVVDYGEGVYGVERVPQQTPAPSETAPQEPDPPQDVPTSRE